MQLDLDLDIDNGVEEEYNEVPNRLGPEVGDTIVQAPEDLSGLAEDMIRQRILHTLWIYPRLSPSMLQIGIGTGFPPALWHPVLEQLIDSGTVIRTQVQATNPVSKREQTYTILTAAPAESI